MMKRFKICIYVLLAAVLFPCLAQASSHREAPGITKHPQIDGTDFYMFRSYEDGRKDYVTFIADYNPLQDPYGGPNYFPLDPEAVYDIHVTNNGDAVEDLTFRFRFKQTSPFISLNVGPPGEHVTQKVSIPLSNAGVVTVGNENSMNVFRSYTVELIKGRTPRILKPHDDDDDDNKENKFSSKKGGFLRDASTGAKELRMPFDNIGKKSMPDYKAYADDFIKTVTIPNCSKNGRVFVGQRKEPFAVNLGETFDLVNVTNPLGAPDAEVSSTEDKNVTTLALEIPIECLTNGNSDIIGGWTTASLPKFSILRDNPSYNHTASQNGPLVQVSRLAHPLVNEVVIGLDKKDLFNASDPKNDAQFLKFVTNPTLPELLEILFGGVGVQAPNNFPRQDLVTVFLTGVTGLNKDGSVGEIMRLNTSILPIAKPAQNNLGVIGGDLAGYPNGRRPGDDTVDISLRVVMGKLCYVALGLCNPGDAPSGLLPLTDGALQNASMFDDKFPYLTTPIAGSPN